MAMAPVAQGYPLPVDGPPSGRPYYGFPFVFPLGFLGPWWGPGFSGYLYAAPKEADSTGFSHYWHWCAKDAAYFPYVKTCPAPWVVVQPGMPPVLVR